jgi:hypothetical protein
MVTGGAHPQTLSFQTIQNSLFMGVSENREMYEGLLVYQGWDDGLGASYPMAGEGLVSWNMYDGGQGAVNCTFMNYPDPTEGKVHSGIDETKVPSHEDRGLDGSERHDEEEDCSRGSAEEAICVSRSLSLHQWCICAFQFRCHTDGHLC